MEEPTGRFTASTNPPARHLAQEHFFAFRTTASIERSQSPHMRRGRRGCLFYFPKSRKGETGRDLRARVHSTVLADVEQQVMALRALHARLSERNLETPPRFERR